MSPGALAFLGGMSDAASTYYFLKRGTGGEGNALVNMVARQQPEATAAAAVGGYLGSRTLTNLIGRKRPRVADALKANLGGAAGGRGDESGFLETVTA